jgi:hypothetical protein
LALLFAAQPSAEQNTLDTGHGAAERTARRAGVLGRDEVPRCLAVESAAQARGANDPDVPISWEAALLDAQRIEVRGGMSCPGERSGSLSTVGVRCLGGWLLRTGSGFATAAWFGWLKAGAGWLPLRATFRRR